MKERTLCWFSTSSDEDDGVICLDDIPPPAKKIKTRQYSEDINEGGRVKRYGFGKALEWFW